ncbi:trigger factor [Clostridium sp. C1]|uniref:trigger factor n=1 Tax=Clostridium sp. C1 TaxID=1155388 RepID=UPI001BABC0C5|nr:trigger factor [Clostridium sp. C1]QUN14279.1 trigger factor [Clostridium sp. C1]
MSKVNQLGNYKGIEVTISSRQVNQEDVEREIQQLLSQRSQLVEKDGTVENGDVTTIDFKGLKDGVAFDGGTAEGYQLEIGSDSFIPGFEEQMIGMVKGETRDLNLTFPENYGAKDLAGADVVFQVTVHHIASKVKAQLDEEFVKSLQIPDVETVDDLKMKIREGLENQNIQALNAEKENKVLGVLIENSDVEVEDEDIQRALDQHVQYVTNELAKQGMALEQYLQMMSMDQDALHAQLMPAAKQQAIFEAIIDEIVKVENLMTSDEDVDRQVDLMAQQYQMDKKDILEKIDLEGLRRDLNRIQASQLILNSAKFIVE